MSPPSGEPAPKSKEAGESERAARALTRWRPIALLVAGAFFMENLDATIIATALPRMADSFHVAPADLNIGISAYLLTLAVFIPISGWIADRYGARSVFLVAIMVFTVASAACGFSVGLRSFTAMRVLQGLGGAMMVPVGRLIVLRNTEKSDLIAAIAYITWPALAAPVLGPPLGGFITTFATWRWIFFVNAPLGLLAAVATLVLTPNVPGESRRPFDVVGFVTSGGACFSFVYALEILARRGANWGEAAAYFTASALAGVFALRHFRASGRPLVNPAALKNKTFRFVLAGGSVFRMAISGAPFLLPLMFQIGFGLNAFQSGLLTLPVFAGNLLMKPATTPTLRAFPFRATLLVNGIATTILFACTALIAPTTAYWAIVVLLFASGLSRSMQFTCVNTLAFAEVTSAEMSGATTMAAMAQQMSMAIGVAYAAVALRAATHLSAALGATAASAAPFRIAFLFVAFLSLLSIPILMRLDPNAGERLRAGS